MPRKSAAGQPTTSAAARLMKVQAPSASSQQMPSAEASSTRDGSGHSLVVNFTDVTARVEAQVALADREAQLVDAQRLARLGSWEWDVTTDEVCWSDEMYRLTGLLPEDVPLDRRALAAYTALVPSHDAAEVARLLTDRDGWREAVDVRHRLTRPDGEQR